MPYEVRSDRQVFARNLRDLRRAKNMKKALKRVNICMAFQIYHIRNDGTEALIQEVV